MLKFVVDVYTRSPVLPILTGVTIPLITYGQFSQQLPTALQQNICVGGLMIPYLLAFPAMLKNNEYSEWIIREGEPRHGRFGRALQAAVLAASGGIVGRVSKIVPHFSPFFLYVYYMGFQKLEKIFGIPEPVAEIDADKA